MTEPEIVKESVLGALGVNWKLFIAQLINFSVVLFVMWKWVYTPLLKAIETRQGRIEKGLKDAEAAARARSSAERESEAAIAAARKEAQRLMEEAVLAAERSRKEMVSKAQSEVAKVVEEGKSRLAEEKEKIVREAKSDIAGLAVAAAEKALGETLTDKHQKTLLDAAVKRIVS
jgi:F-type H+-transporting ATPase subunit b